CPYSRRELAHIAGWCTDRDQFAKKVERFMRKVASAMLLLNRVGDVFEGIVTGASDKGTYVRLLNPPAEGRVIRRFEGMDIGEKVSVRLVKLSPEMGYIAFEGVQVIAHNPSHDKEYSAPRKPKRNKYKK